MKKKIIPIALAAGIVFSGTGQALGATGNQVINTGDNYLGKPYNYGAPVGDTSSFDCSSFTVTVFKKHGVNLPRTSRSQAKVGKWVSKSNLKKGDLLFYDTDFNGTINHVTIYAGNGKMLGAQSSTGVAFTNAFSSYWGKRYVKAKRVLNTSKTSKKVVSTATKKVSSNASSYTVRSGDSLWKIGMKYNMTVTKLKKLNRLKSNTIYPGQKLKVSGTAAKKTTRTYRVKSGDNLWEISMKYRTTVTKIKKANKLSSNTIYPGKTLKIPR